MDSDILNITSSSSIIIFIVYYIIKNFHKCKSKCCDKEIEFSLSNGILNNHQLSKAENINEEKNIDMI